MSRSYRDSFLCIHSTNLRCRVGVEQVEEQRLEHLSLQVLVVPVGLVRRKFAEVGCELQTPRIIGVEELVAPHPPPRLAQHHLHALQTRRVRERDFFLLVNGLEFFDGDLLNMEREAKKREMN